MRSRARFVTDSAARSESATGRGQEDQLSALGLVTNAVVLWNTLYIEAALEQLRSDGYEVRPEDVARLSPLPSHHINVLGRYSFSLSEQVANGGMRPLRSPDDDNTWPLAQVFVPLIVRPVANQ